MPRLVLDTIGSNYAHVRTIPAQKFGYLNGAKSAWPIEAQREQHARGELLALIDVLGTQPHQAAILDWEAGDVQDPARLRWWVAERNGFRGDAVVYTDKANLAAVIGALHDPGEYYQLLVANLTDDGQPPKEATDFHLPPHVHLLGEQYAWPAKTGGPYDLSIIWNDAWHAPGRSAAHVTMADAESGTVADGGAFRAPDANERQDGQASTTADVAAAPPVFPADDLAAAVFGPKEEIPGGSTSSAPPWETEPPFAMPAPASMGPDPSTALELQGPWGEITPGDAAGTDREPAPDDQPFLGRPYVGAHSAATTAAAAGIDHAAVWRWIQAGQQFAEDFRGAGAGHVAGVLEHALGGVLEVGKLLGALGR